MKCFIPCLVIVALASMCYGKAIDQPETETPVTDEENAKEIVPSNPIKHPNLLRKIEKLMKKIPASEERTALQHKRIKLPFTYTFDEESEEDEIFKLQGHWENDLDHLYHGLRELYNSHASSCILTFFESMINCIESEQHDTYGDNWSNSWDISDSYGYDLEVCISKAIIEYELCTMEQVNYGNIDTEVPEVKNNYGIIINNVMIDLSQAGISVANGISHSDDAIAE